MATGAGLGGLLYALMPLIGIVTVLHARAKRKRGGPIPKDQGFEDRQATTQETERRMAAYLAQRHAGSYEADQGQTEQEVKR